MNARGRILLSLLTCCVLTWAHGAKKPSTKIPKKVRSAVVDLKSDDYFRVSSARNKLESQQVRSIPALIDLLDSTERVVLTRNVHDLIYPGARPLPPKGGVVNYEIDWIAVRAGWVLEELTFQDFGFSGGLPDWYRLTNLRTSEEIVQQYLNPRRWDREPPRERASYQEAISKAHAWWQSAQAEWSRFDALAEAMAGDNALRQAMALGWLRHGKTSCDGLNPKTYEVNVLPLVRQLAESGQPAVKEQAQLLVDDDEGAWWKWKTEWRD